VSFAAVGLAFCFVVYIDGLRYSYSSSSNSNSAPDEAAASAVGLSRRGIVAKERARHHLRLQNYGAVDKYSSSHGHASTATGAASGEPHSPSRFFGAAGETYRSTYDPFAQYEAAAAAGAAHGARGKEDEPFFTSGNSSAFGGSSGTSSGGAGAVKDSEADFWRRESYGLRGSVVAPAAGSYSDVEEQQQQQLRAQQRAASRRSRLGVMQLFTADHHPGSPEFLPFIYGKVLMLLLTWVVLLIYWLLMFPQLLKLKPVAVYTLWNVDFRFAVAGCMVVLLGAVWMYWLAKVVCAIFIL
jgi:hypothetical protein